MAKKSNGYSVTTGYALVYVQTMQKDASLVLSDEPIAIVKSDPKTIRDGLLPHKLQPNQRFYLMPIAMKDANRILELQGNWKTSFIQAYRKLKHIKGGYI